MARALVVDCDLARGSVTREVVCELGLDVSLALDAFEALDVLRLDERPALLVTELALPAGRRGDGLSLVRRLRSLCAGAQPTRAVVLSSSMEMRERAAAVRDELQIDAILSTAVSRSSLKRVLSGLVPSFAPAGMMRRSQRPHATATLPTLASLAVDVGADFGLSGLHVATGGVAPVSRCITPLVSSDHRVLGQLYVASSMRAVARETMEVIAREVVREFEAARMDRAMPMRR
jgi:CheY-like chemotaxis protein